jgi:hypothetical protein
MSARPEETKAMKISFHGSSLEVSAALTSKATMLTVSTLVDKHCTLFSKNVMLTAA